MDIVTFSFQAYMRIAQYDAVAVKQFHTVQSCIIKVNKTGILKSFKGILAIQNIRHRKDFL